MLIVSTSVIYALVTGEHIIFSSQPPAAASVVMVHLGGAFSPNDVTLLLSGFIALNVLISMVFFLRQVRAKARPDRSLVFGISLTGVAIVIELLGFLFQWSF